MFERTKEVLALLPEISIKDFFQMKRDLTDAEPGEMKAIIPGDTVDPPWPAGYDLRAPVLHPTKGWRSHAFATKTNRRRKLTALGKTLAADHGYRS
jgi:hypothetical protein